MKRVICAVFDSAVQAFGQPIFCRSIGEGLRSFADEINRKGADHMLSAHPEDYVLHLLGTFDDESGDFDGSDGRVLARGQDVLEKVQ